VSNADQRKEPTDAGGQDQRPRQDTPERDRPEEQQPAEEWGERNATGSTIARGGKES
jgi:hypothetical protein